MSHDSDRRHARREGDGRTALVGCRRGRVVLLHGISTLLILAGTGWLATAAASFCCGFSASSQPRPEQVRRRVSEEEELQALLAQAEALRKEAAQEEEALQAQRGEREAEEAKEAAEAARKAEEEAKKARQEAERKALIANAQLSTALGKLRKAEADGLQGEEMEGIRREVVEAQKLVAEFEPQRQVPAPAPPSAQASAPGGGRAPRIMSEAEWASLAQRFPQMSIQEKFKMNKELGPQGRRKLAALIKGKEGGVFIVPGAQVQVAKNPLFLRASFRRFPRNSVNGYSEDKMARRGQDCLITATFQDGTCTCKFEDGVSFDFPWESIEGFDTKDSNFV